MFEESQSVKSLQNTFRDLTVKLLDLLVEGRRSGDGKLAHFSGVVRNESLSLIAQLSGVKP